MMITVPSRKFRSFEIAEAQAEYNKIFQSAESAGNFKASEFSRRHCKAVITNLCLFFLLSFVGCSLFTPAPVKKMPMIKVLHEGKVESLSLENYVACVLAGEVSQSWPLEALKAQAVASRTFALLRMADRKNNTFHVQNSVMDQVLKAKPNEVFIKATRETAGVVLMHDDAFAETSFHSTCGGKTTNAKSVWGRSYPHLQGTDCGYCNASPTYNWEAEIKLSDLESKFSQTISNIKILSRSKDGRVLQLELKGNRKQVIGGHEFRMAIGAMKVKSTFMKEIAVEGPKVLVKGSGFGHGVGMCQYGAMGMAKSGKKFKEILAHYYKGTRLRKIY